SCRGTVVRRLLSIEIRIGGAMPASSTLTPKSFILAKPESRPIPLLSSRGVQSMRRYSESWATARSQSRRLIPPGGGTACSEWPNGMEPSLRRSYRSCSKHPLTTESFMDFGNMRCIRIPTTQVDRAPICVECGVASKLRKFDLFAPAHLKLVRFPARSPLPSRLCLDHSHCPVL